MTNEIAPYTFSDYDLLPSTNTAPLAPGQYHAVHFLVPAEQLTWHLEKLGSWFYNRDEVILVGSGISMDGEGFIVMEWEECEIDPLFLKILEHEDTVTDVCVYVREEEVA